MDVFGEGGNIKKSETLSKKFNQHPYLLTYLIISSFLLLAIIGELLIMHAHFMTAGQDLQFHWERIEELKASIKAGNWLPQFATNQYNAIGSAVMSFYPYLTLMPIAIISIFIKSNLLLVYVMFILLTFISMIIAYYSSLGVSKKRSTSYLFSVIYGLSATHIDCYFYAFDIGVFLTLAVLPLAIFGFICFINNSNWLEMAIGISLIIFSHVLNSLFIIVLLTVWLLINVKQVNKDKVKNLIKAIVVVLCITCMFWLPAMNLYFNNKIQKPATFFKLGGTSFPVIFTSALSNSLTFNNSDDFLNIFDIVAAIIIAILFYKHFDRILKQIYWISIALIFISSNLFPWHLFQNYLAIIQFPWRLFIFPELFLDYIFAIGITKYIKSVRINKFLFTCSILLVIILSISGQNQIIESFGQYPDLNYNASLKVPNNGQHAIFKLSKSNQFNNIAHNDVNDDYYLVKSKPMENQLFHTQGLYDLNKTLQFNYVKNGKFTFNNNSGNKINELNLPFLDYNGENYKVYLDHHIIPSHANKTQLLTINNVKQGNHTVKIIPTVNVITRAGRIISIIGILLYLFFALAKWLRKIKISRRKKRIKAVE